MPPCAMSDGLLTGSNEIGLAFGEALAPNSDGLAKPTAVERRVDPVVAIVCGATGESPPGVMWVMAGFP